MDEVQMPAVSGPITGGKGWIFGSPIEDLTQAGYRLDEYFIEGDACLYNLVEGATATLDGRWDVAPGERAPYRTRMYVAVPADPAAFNGTVLVNWQNVTMGADLGSPTEHQIAQGFAWVGVTTQRVAMEGQPSLTDDMPATTGLCDWDPDRYGALHHPGDAYSYDIFSQAVRYLRDGRGSGLDVLHGLDPQRFVAIGGSQSAMRLGSYINIAHNYDRVIDGFLLTVHWGLCPPPPDMSLVESFNLTEELRFAASAQIRDDSGTPILVLTSESEAPMMEMVRQPDSDTFRFWEMAGTAHAGGDLRDVMQPILERDGLAGGFLEVPDRNEMWWDYIEHAALARLLEWIDTGNPPASIPPIERDPEQPGALRTDMFGNALGGVRLPELVAPLAVHSGSHSLEGAGALAGRTVPFTKEQVAETYADAAAFLKAWDGAVDDLHALGLVLDAEVEGVKARGRTLVERVEGAWG